MSDQESDRLVAVIGGIEQELNQVILGQQELIRMFLAGILAGGHILLEGLPGMGKTQMVRAFCALSGLRTSRIQFTPDLMPLDITGSNLLHEENGRREFVFNSGPVFANLVVADEINRASPKTQSALLEAMQEGQVTVLGNTHRLPQPFSVLATQNPIELEGTYPLPEAQLDRFLFKLDVLQVGVKELCDIAEGKAGGAQPDLQAMATAQEIAQVIQVVRAIPISHPVAEYVARLVFATRPSESGPGMHARFGVSPRAVIGMTAAARARAFLDGRITVGFEDVRAVAGAVLRHRIIVDYQSRLGGYDADRVVRDILETVPELSRSEPDSLVARVVGGIR